MVKENSMRPIVEHWENGFPKTEGYYVNGKRHRDDGPAYQTWFNDGRICLIELYKWKSS